MIVFFLLFKLLLSLTLDQDKDYVKKRKKNNEAVKNCREKAKKKADQVAKTIETLKSENGHLEERKKLLSKELGLLKELYKSHGGK